MDNHKKHSLGQRAFMLFLLKRMKFVLFLFALTASLWYSRPRVPRAYIDWAEYANQMLLLAGAAYFLLILIKTYLEYRAYTYMFTEEAFIMTFGYLQYDEVAALYHQIQNVNINRSVLDRFIGVSKVIILMIGSERETRRAHIVLPGVGKSKAKLVQKELLIRARKHTLPAQTA